MVEMTTEEVILVETMTLAVETSEEEISEEEISAVVTLEEAISEEEEISNNCIVNICKNIPILVS